MTETITESIEHLDFETPALCEASTCKVGNPPAVVVLKMKCGQGPDHGHVYCADCARRWREIAAQLDALPIPIPHRQCGSFDPVLVHGKMEPLP